MTVVASRVCSFECSCNRFIFGFTPLPSTNGAVCVYMIIIKTYRIMPAVLTALQRKHKWNPSMVPLHCCPCRGSRVPNQLSLMGAERIMDHHARARQVNGLHVSNQRTMQNLCRGLNLRYCVQRTSHESHAMRRTVATVAAAKICLKSWSRDSRDDRL